MTDVKRSSNHEANERSEPGQRFDGVVPYIRGPGWPNTATENDAPINPWSKQHWNLTGQAKIIKRDRAEADRLARAAGHRDAATSRLKNAR
jgi:hypothetical protein